MIGMILLVLASLPLVFSEKIVIDGASPAKEAPVSPPFSQAKIDEVTIGGQEIKIPSADRDLYFEKKGGNWKLKDNAGFDSSTGIWTSSAGLTSKYSSDGLVAISNYQAPPNSFSISTGGVGVGKEVVYSPSGYSLNDVVSLENKNGKAMIIYPDKSVQVNDEIIPPVVVKQAGGTAGIDFSKDVSDVSLSTANGGTINWQTSLSGIQMISQTTPAAEAGKPATVTTTLTLPNGQKLEGTEAAANIAELKDKTLKLGDEEYKVTHVDLSEGAAEGKIQITGKEKILSFVSNNVQGTVTVTEKKGETITTTQYETDGFGGVVSKKTKIEEDGKVQGETVVNYETDSQGKVVKDHKSGQPVVKEIGTAVFEGDKKQYTKYTDKKTGAVSYGFEPEGEVKTVYPDASEVRIHVSSDGEKVCIGTCDSSDNFVSPEGLSISNCWIGGTICTPNMVTVFKEKAKVASEERKSEVFWQTAGDIVSGKTDVQKTIGSILGLRPGWESLSTWLAPDTTNKWRKWASNTFDSLMLAEYVVPKAVCDYDEAHKTKKPGSYSAFIEVAPGITQSVISFQAERAEAGYILCDEEIPCTGGYECKKSLCTKDGQPVSGYLYKLFWGVSAPRDEEFTPYLDENGVAVSFNFKLKGASGEIYLYSLDGILKGAVQLKNGASDKEAIAHYSPADFNQFCVEWKQPPEDLDGDEISDDCIDIISTSAGSITYGEGESAGSTTVSSGQVQKNLNW